MSVVSFKNAEQEKLLHTFIDTIDTFTELKQGAIQYSQMSPQGELASEEDWSNTVEALDQTVNATLYTIARMKKTVQDREREFDALECPWPMPQWMCDYIEEVHTWTRDTATDAQDLINSIGKKGLQTVQEWLRDTQAYLEGTILPALQNILTQLGELGLEALEEIAETLKGLAWIVQNLWWIIPVTIASGIGLFIGTQLLISKISGV